MLLFPEPCSTKKENLNISWELRVQRGIMYEWLFVWETVPHLSPIPLPALLVNPCFLPLLLGTSSSGRYILWQQRLLARKCLHILYKRTFFKVLISALYILDNQIGYWISQLMHSYYILENLNISESFSNAKFFFLRYFLWEVFILFVTLSSFRPVNLPTLSSSGCVCRVFNDSSVSTPWSASSSVTPLMFDSYWVDQKVCLGFSIRCYRKTQASFLANPIFHFQYSLFLSLLYFNLCWPVSCFDYPFLSDGYSPEFTPGDKESAQLHNLPCMCEPNNRCAVTNHDRLWKN